MDDISSIPSPRRLLGVVQAQHSLSSSMIRLDLDLEDESTALPGQFCMINLADEAALALPRPLSLLGVEGRRLSLLYKPVGRGTRRLATAAPGTAVRVLTPLGTAFPPPRDDRPRLLLAGGVGLPPLAFWAARYGRTGDLCCFGARDGGDAPWDLLSPPWRTSVDEATGLPPGREARRGNVIELARHLLRDSERDHVVLACGPTPLLRAAADLAASRGWDCRVSVEERMGCGYGVCRGCVVPTPDGGPWNLACREGPVLGAGDVDWERFGLDPLRAAESACADGACGKDG